MVEGLLALAVVVALGGLGVLFRTTGVTEWFDGHLVRLGRRGRGLPGDSGGEVSGGGDGGCGGGDGGGGGSC